MTEAPETLTTDEAPLDMEGLKIQLDLLRQDNRKAFGELTKLGARLDTAMILALKFETFLDMLSAQDRCALEIGFERRMSQVLSDMAADPS